MRIVVVGATGRTGRLVVEQGIARGHAITAFARRPEALAGVRGLAGVIAGDALDLDAVRAAVVGQDAVLCAVGMSPLVRNLLVAMPEAGVRRVVMTSSRSVTATRPWLLVTGIWIVLREAYVDLARAEGMLEGSNLDWTIARATRLVDGPGAGRVHVDYEANATGGDWSLVRADYATFLLDATADPGLIRRAPGICGPARRAA